MSKLKVLYFAADPLSIDGSRPRLLLDGEARKIEDEVNAAIHREAVDFRSRWATRIRDLGRALRRFGPHIVHFSGHGGADGLVLEGEDGLPPRHLGAEALRRFFQAYHDGNIKLVVLNACYSRPQAQAIADVVGCAIGTPSRISDRDSITFSTAFYSSIADGRSVQVAFNQACAELNLNACPEDEIPQLLVGEGVDASKLVLIPADAGLPTPPPAALGGSLPRVPKRMARIGGSVALAGAAAFAVAAAVRPDPACAPAREVQRAAMEAAASSARAADPDDNRPGARVLVHAKLLHDAGRHTADLAYFRQAAGAGNAEAMTSLGLAHLHGEGTTVDEDSGLYWLREAAERKDPRALNELGKAYERRQGVSRDSDHLAAQRYEAAAALGHAEAMRNLGNLYRDGRGVQGNALFALEWFVKSARAGFVDAMLDVGSMYEDGKGMPRDRGQAYCWYRAAADAGSARGRAIVADMDVGSGR